VLGVFVSGHKFYVCDFRTKHKICILAYHNLCFCVFVFLGMLQYQKGEIITYTLKLCVHIYSTCLNNNNNSERCHG
jgi:hypothetical protein